MQRYSVLLGLALSILFLSVHGREEIVGERDVSKEIENPLYTTYVPEFVEVRAASVNIALHGIYKRDDSLILKKETTPWYGGNAARPVFVRRTAKEGDTLYLYWNPLPSPQWRIGKKFPVRNPKQVDRDTLLGITPSFAYSPVFSRGWFVATTKTDEEKQMRLEDAELQALSGLTAVQMPSKKGVPDSFVWDDNLLIDEARSGTFSVLGGVDREPGCPIKKDGPGITALENYDVDPCLPPRFFEPESNELTERALEFTLTGAEGLLRAALFAWAGYFLKRPYFALRSPLTIDVPHGTTSVEPRVLFLWAEGLANPDVPPQWFISRELGNKHPGQLFARWSLTAPAPKTLIHADWPGEPGTELPPSHWELFRPAVKRSEQIGTVKEQLPVRRTTIQIKAELPTAKKIILRGGPDDLQGEYYLLGSYLGYPYFRQKQTKTNPGYVLYRGHVIAADKDSWVIGAMLGSTEGLRAYCNDDNARWPHLIDISWWIWDHTDTYTWVKNPDIKLSLAFNKASAVPGVQQRIFPQCVLPRCNMESELPLCPATGTCLECTCEEKQRVLRETQLRRQTDDRDFISDMRVQPFLQEVDDSNVNLNKKVARAVGQLEKISASEGEARLVYLVKTVIVFLFFFHIFSV